MGDDGSDSGGGGGYQGDLGTDLGNALSGKLSAQEQEAMFGQEVEAKFGAEEKAALNSSGGAATKAAQTPMTATQVEAFKKKEAEDKARAEMGFIDKTMSAINRALGLDKQKNDVKEALAKLSAKDQENLFTNYIDPAATDLYGTAGDIASGMIASNAGSVLNAALGPAAGLPEAVARELGMETVSYGLKDMIQDNGMRHYLGGKLGLGWALDSDDHKRDQPGNEAIASSKSNLNFGEATAKDQASGSKEVASSSAQDKTDILSTMRARQIKNRLLKNYGAGSTILTRGGGTALSDDTGIQKYIKEASNTLLS